MTDTASHVMEEAAGYIDESGGFTAFVRDYGLGGLVMAIFMRLIEIVDSFGLLLLGPVRALGRGLIALIDGTIGGMLEVLDAGTAASVESYLNGTAALLGPLAQPAAVGTIMISMAVFIYGFNRLDIDPFIFIRSIRR